MICGLENERAHVAVLGSEGCRVPVSRQRCLGNGTLDANRDIA
jgi:hypothetical protein